MIFVWEAGFLWCPPDSYLADCSLQQVTWMWKKSRLGFPLGNHPSSVDVLWQDSSTTYFPAKCFLMLQFPRCLYYSYKSKWHLLLLPFLKDTSIESGLEIIWKENLIILPQILFCKSVGLTESVFSHPERGIIFFEPFPRNQRIPPKIYRGTGEKWKLLNIISITFINWVIFHLHSVESYLILVLILVLALFNYYLLMLILVLGNVYHFELSIKKVE